MVTFIAGLGVLEVQFTRDGEVHDSNEVDALLAHVEQARPARLLVLAHGWNNDMEEARSLYRRLLERLAAAGSPTEGTVVLATLWPSKRFAEEELIASGAASLGGRAGPGVGELRQQVEELRDVLDLGDGDVVRLRALAADLEDDAGARTRFAELLLAHVPTDALAAEEGARPLVEADPAEVLVRLAAPVLPGEGGHGRDGGGGALGGAAGGVGGAVGRVGGVGGAGGGGAVDGGAAGLLSGLRGAARTLLNLTTYWAMKHRAGVVGTRGLAPLLAQVHARTPDTALVLAGHSFGGRLVTAATLGVEGAAPVPVAGLLLLQAAFSHHGFAQRFDGEQDGAFRSALLAGRLTGPLVVTHTANDRAVGLAYPLASRMAGHVASALGDADDRFGGIGRNGALATPESVQGELRGDGPSVPLTAGRVVNLRADATISSHADVANDATAAVLAALLAGAG